MNADKLVLGQQYNVLFSSHRVAAYTKVGTYVEHQAATLTTREKWFFRLYDDSGTAVVIDLDRISKK